MAEYSEKHRRPRNTDIDDRDGRHSTGDSRVRGDRSRSRDSDRDRHGSQRNRRSDRYEDDDSSGDDRRHRDGGRNSFGGSGGGKGRWNDSIPNNILLVRGLPEDATESDISEELLRAGINVMEVRVMRNKDSGTSLRYCFVEFHRIADAQYWMELNQGQMRFRDTFTLNMYYSTSRRGNLHPSLTMGGGEQDMGDSSSSQTSSLNDWTCVKCSCKNFQRRTHCRRCNHSKEESDRVHGGDGLDQVGSNPCNTLILRGLDGLTTEENIINAFAAITTFPIKNVRVIRDDLTGVSNGYAYVEMTSLRESKEFLDYLEQLGTPLEVDGKGIIVSYAKNTFTTALATLEQQRQMMQAQQNCYDYSMYYYQAAQAATAAAAAESAAIGASITKANATNAAAAVAQAAIMKSNQKKIIQAGPTLAAPAMLHGQQAIASAAAQYAVGQPEYPIYPVPDVSTYTYDETSGYYFDPYTGLYYDPNTQYYYNAEAQQFMYWDGEKRTYLPAPTSTDASTAATTNQSKEETDAKKGNEPDKKVKVAKKLVKDMEKWAKKLNAQKEAQKDEIKKLISGSMTNPPTATASQSAAAADAGFSLLEKSVNRSISVPETRPQEISSTYIPPQPAAAAVAAVASMVRPETSKTSAMETSSASTARATVPGNGSGGAGGAVTEEELVDWSKLTCLLCRRAFPTKEVLIKHQQMSELHKTNLEELIKARGGSSADAMMQSLQYRDRAKERREKYGLPEPPQPKRGKAKVEEAEEPIPLHDVQPTVRRVKKLMMFVQPTQDGIKDDNIGFRLAKKMGWEDGKGLGRANQGIVDPIEAKQRQATAGLGSRGSAYSIDTSGSYKDRARKTFQAYFQEIN